MKDQEVKNPLSLFSEGVCVLPLTSMENHTRVFIQTKEIWAVFRVIR